MSVNRKISNLPAVTGASILDTDILPLVASGVTSRTTIADIRVKLGFNIPTGRTVTDPSIYFANNAVFNVKDFGAFGDNSHNDYIAINAAQLAALAAGGGTVFFPKGTYLIGTSLTARFGITYRGEHEYDSIIKPSADVHGFTMEEYGVGLGAINFEHLGFNGISTTGKAAIKNAGTADRTQQSYGFNMRYCNIQNFNVAIALRSWRNVRISNNWFQNVTQGIDLTGWLLDIFIDTNWIVYATGAGAGTKDAITINSFNFVTVGGVSRPETVHVHNNVLYGFDYAVRAVSGLNIRITDNDIQAILVGIDFTSIEASLVIDNNYIQGSGSACTNGIIGHGLGSVLSQPSVSITKNLVIGSSTAATSVGIEINDAGNSNQDNVTLFDNTVISWSVADIRVNNGNGIKLLHNKSYSAASTYGIRIAGSVGTSRIVLDENIVSLSISYANALLISSGAIRNGVNTIAGVRVGGQGNWTTPAFAAGDFTASGTMTWTLAAGDVDTYAYTVKDRVMTVSFALKQTTVGGVLGTTLKIKIPAGFVATKNMFSATANILDNAVIKPGYAYVLATGTVINVEKQDGTNWTAAADTTAVYGQISFEVDAP